MEPIGEEKESFIAVVREKLRNTAYMKAIYVGLGPIGQKILNLPALSKAVQITVHRNDDDPIESYTAIAPASMLTGVSTHQAVWIGLESREAADKRVWIVTSIEPLL